MRTRSGFFISPGNSKVAMPLVTSGSAHSCPSAPWCRFSLQNYKSSGSALCYAIGPERSYPDCLPCRENNARLIRSHGAPLGVEVAERLAKYFQRSKKHRIIRINEAGDISADNLSFHLALVRRCKHRRIKVYGYSKAPAHLVDAVRQAGAVILQSESDFIAVKTTEEAKRLKLPLCPGKCGPSHCMRCPSGKRTAIIEH